MVVRTEDTYYENNYPSLGPAAVKASAAIASVGGNYTGNIDYNLGDPQGNQTLPRKLLINPTFELSTSQIDELVDNICKSCAPVVVINDITPTSQEICLNGNALDLVADATGTGTLSYQWYSNTINSNSGGTLLSGNTSAILHPTTTNPGTKYYYVVVSDSYCEGIAISTPLGVTVLPTPCAQATCTKPAASGTPSGYTLIGISNQTKDENWPENIPNGWLALESKEKGFVITRIQNESQITDKKEGMLIYDIDAGCVKLYNGTTWHCIEKSCNE